jgi:ATP-binding cassette subfamily F protein uup
VPVLTAKELRRAYGPHNVLDGVSLSVHSGERVGLVGNNGSGKSTLARILAAVEGPDTGEVAWRRDAAVQYLPQEPSFDGDPTAYDVAMEGLGEWRRARARYDEISDRMARQQGDLDALLEEQSQAAAEIERRGGWEIAHQAEAILGHLGVERLEQRVSTMSGGERRRVALARILVARPELAVLDEPTNHLDADTIDWLEQHLSNEFPGALLLITHDRYLLDRVVTRTLELDHGSLHSYEGGWEAYLEAKAERLAHEARAEANRQRFLKRELEWLRRQPKARGTKQKARVQRVGEARQPKTPKRKQVADLQMDSVRSGRTILELHDLTLEAGGKRLIGGLDLHLTAADRIGIVGRNGSGKTSLLRSILGELEPTAGEVVKGKNTKIAYLAQSRASLDDDASIHENVAGKRTEVEVGGRLMDIRSYLGQFLFEPGRIRQPVGSLSGGERARVALARLLLEPANLLLLDEPTNDLDVDTLGALEQMLTSFPGSALVVTHDRYFLDRIATSILAFEGEGRVLRYEGNYSTYRSLRAEAEQQRAQQQRAEQKRARASDNTAPPQQAPKGLSSKERKELDDVLQQVDEAEQRVSELEQQLSDPDLYAKRGEDVPGIQAELERVRQERDRAMERWEELEALREERQGPS